MTALEALRIGLERVKRGWTQGDFARDASAHVVGTSSGAATCWCSVGAILVCADGSDTYEQVLCLLGQANGTQSCDIVAWNDTPGRTQAEVIAAFEAAIALAEKEGA